MLRTAQNSIDVVTVNRRNFTEISLSYAEDEPTSGSTLVIGSHKTNLPMSFLFGKEPTIKPISIYRSFTNIGVGNAL